MDMRSSSLSDSTASESKEAIASAVVQLLSSGSFDPATEAFAFRRWHFVSSDDTRLEGDLKSLDRIGFAIDIRTGVHDLQYPALVRIFEIDHPFETIYMVDSVVD